MSDEDEGGDSRAKKMMKTAGQFGFGCQLILTTAAVCCGFVAVGSCAFADRDVQLVPGSNIADLCADFAQNECNVYAENHAVAYWSWQGTTYDAQKVCLSYTQPVPGVGYVTLPVDSKFNTGAVGLILGTIFGLLAFFTLMIASCCPLDPKKMAGLSCYYFLATLFQGLSFMIFPSIACQKGFFAPYYPDATTLMESIESASCSLGLGAKSSVAATVLYFVCMFTAPFSAPPPPIGGYPQGGGEPGDMPGDDGVGDEEPAAGGDDAGEEPAGDDTDEKPAGDEA